MTLVNVNNLKMKKNNLKRTTTLIANTELPSLPEDIRLEISKFKMADYALQFFREQRNLFYKKIPIEKAFEHTKTPLKASLLLASDELSKEATDMFKWVMDYMGDRPKSFFFEEKSIPPLEIAHMLMKLAVDTPQLRDELYCQLVKQTTKNPSEESKEKGWELLCMALETNIAPSKEFEGYLRNHFLSSSKEDPNPRVVQFALYCQDRLGQLIAQPKAPRLPNEASLAQAKDAPFVRSVFRSSLLDMMRMQSDSYPNLKIPIVLKTLCDSVLESNGLQAVGIFRVAAQGDEVAKLRQELEASNGIKCEPPKDPHIPACLIKQWLSEIRTPVIPPEFYDDVLDNSGIFERLMEIIKRFPEINRNILFYLVNFLQCVARSADTKMTYSNIAIVMSPTLCRCPKDNPLLVMQQTVLESEFICTLLINLPQQSV